MSEAPTIIEAMRQLWTLRTDLSRRIRQLSPEELTTMRELLQEGVAMVELELRRKEPSR